MLDRSGFLGLGIHGLEDRGDLLALLLHLGQGGVERGEFLGQRCRQQLGATIQRRLLVFQILGRLVEVRLAGIEHAAGRVVWIDGLVHPFEQTIGPREQLLDLRTQLLVVQCRGELGAVELQGAIFLGVDTQLTERGQLVSCPHFRQHLAHITQQRPGSRVVGQRTKALDVAIGIFLRCDQRSNSLLQGVIGIDERLHGFLQAFVVQRNSRLRGITARGDTGELERQATDGLVDGILRAFQCQPVDGELRVLGQTTDVTRTTSADGLSTVDGQLRNTTDRDVATLAGRGRAEHQARTARLVDDVGGNAVGAHFLVDLVAHALQRGTAGDIDLVVLAVLTDGQLTGADRRAGTTCELLAGNLGGGSQLVDLDIVGPCDRRVARLDLDHFLVSGSACEGIERRRVLVVELLHGVLERRQGAAQGTDTGDHRGVVARLPSNLVGLGRGVGIHQHADDVLDIEPVARTRVGSNRACHAVAPLFDGPAPLLQD
ncbi:hypothetical protein WR25_25010 [Diploscapter pachys]|uniref:NAD-specific glutamate dehydrogenase n=1 Tax=Diploscapter pachys TaxID=2018661 RepID=A0A2A2M2P1_9BILA|nr:hypothetical protein WR25_25010 [Diploscapter pachys]